MKHVPEALNTVVMSHNSNRQLLPRKPRVYENGELWSDIKTPTASTAHFSKPTSFRYVRKIAKSDY